MTSERFASRLRELREAKGWTQQQLADAAGLKLGGIRDLEQARRSPTWETVLALAAALGVDCTAFTQEPAASPEPRPRGRPRKPAAVPEASAEADQGEAQEPAKAKAKRTKKED